MSINQGKQPPETSSPPLSLPDINRELDRALIYHRSGQYQRAEVLYEKILSNYPNHAEALHLLGVVAHQQGDTDKSAVLISAAIRENPQNPFYYSSLGDLLRDQGKPNEALSCYQKAIEFKPDLFEAYYNIGNTLLDLGNFKDAISVYQKAIAVKPDYFEAYYNMGTAYHEQNKLDRAVSCYQKAVALKPDSVEAHHNIGIAFQKMGKLDQAISSYKKVIQLNPNKAETWYNLGIAFQDLNQLDQAVFHYKKALQVKPRYPEAFYNMGNSYKDQGKHEHAVANYQKALELKPDLAEAYNNMGIVFKDQDKLDKAISCYKKALELRPDFIEAYYNMGIALQIDGRYEDGLAFYEQALQIDPDYSPARWLYHLSLPILYDTREDILYYRNRFTKHLDTLIQQVRLDTPEQRASALKGVGSTTNFYLQCQGFNDLDLQMKYGKFVCRIMAANYPQWVKTKDMPPLKANERIRIGYVSSFMKSHTVGQFLLGWIENATRSDFEIYCYYIDNQSDQITREIERKSDHFFQSWGNLESVANQIISDNLHILIFTDIGMNAPATQIAGLRLAPVQCKGWGFPITTGLPTMDYYLSSDLMEPENAQEHYSETLIRLPNIALVYKKPDLPKHPKSRKEFGIKEKAFVYLISQSLFKCLPQYDSIYPRIAQKVPNAQFVFLYNPSPKVTQQFKDRLSKAFQAHQLNFSEFCLFQPRLYFEDFLSLNLASDVLLDTPGWSGGKTTIEGISCGLPVVTYPGNLMRLRHTYAMLIMMGVTETIAENEKDYIEIASSLGRDKELYLELKRKMKDNQDKLFNDRTLIRALENFFRTTLQKNVSLNRAVQNDYADSNHFARLCDGLMSQGKLEEAIECYEAAIGKNPESFKVYFNLGNAYQIQGKSNEAISCYEKALDLKPDSVEALYNTALAFHVQGNFHKAIDWYKKTLKENPAWVDAHYNLGSAFEDVSKLEEAIINYQKAIQLKPNHEKAHYNLGNLMLKQGKYSEAISCFKKAVFIRPDLAKAHNNMGKAYKEQEKTDDAISCFQKALQIDPKLAESHFNLGEVFQLLNDLEAAVRHYNHAIQLKPDLVEAYNNLGNALREQKEFGRAIDCYNHVLHFRPDLAEAYYNIGSALRSTEQFDAATKNLLRALELKPGYAEAYNNLGLTFKGQGDIKKAIEYLRKAVQYKPDLAEAHWNLSLTLLLNGDFDEGWKEFEWRFQLNKWKSIYPYRNKMPRWNGSYAMDKAIFIHDEQGLGDTFQFLRYLPMVKARCGKIIFETRKSIIGLLKGYPGIDEVVERSDNGKPPVAFDLYIPLLSLPGLLGTTPTTIPAKVPYLHADPAKVKYWESRISRPGFKVGLVWAGRPLHPNDQNRSCPLENFHPLSEIQGMQLYGLQKGEAAAQADRFLKGNGLDNLGEAFKDFSDTAGAIANLDLVISVDTAVAHLAGAMGKPVWVLLPLIPDWRWMMDRQYSPWYPTMRLFRQEKRRGWGPVLRRVEEELRVLVAR
jgi:protein O-GlcNAc transferase